MIKLTFGLTREPRLEPLIDGTVRPQNIELDFVFGSPGEIHYRNLKYDEFDVFQMSISEFIMAKERGGNSKWQWSGLPVFLSKAFLWLNLYVGTSTGIKALNDLKGKRVGIPDYPMTAALWMRIFLRELYGIHPQEITWFNGRTKEFSHAALFELDKIPLPKVTIQWLTSTQTLDCMLAGGELEAAYGIMPRHTGDFATLDRYGGTPIAANERIQKLFPDCGRQIITDFHRRTGVIPSNHMYAVQSSILERAPWVALELYKAFQKSKQVAYERARCAISAYLLFEGHDFADQAQIFGEDPYPLGVKQNRKMLEILFRGSHEEGLTQKLARIIDVFHASTLDT